MERWRMHLALMAAILAAPGLSRATVPEALEPVLACADEKDAAARLACFDAAVARLRRAPAPVAATAAPVAVPATTPPVATASAASAAAATPAPSAPSPLELTPEERFGLRGDQLKEKTGEISRLTANVSSIGAKPRGELVITLDNGQVWEEIAPGSTIKLKPGDSVKIEAGTLRSFFLIAPNGRSSRVSRVR